MPDPAPDSAAPPETFAGILARLDAGAYDYSPAGRRKVRGALTRAAERYRLPLASIRADLAAFDTKWGRGPVKTVPRGFDSARQFRTWRSQLRGLLQKALDVEACPAPPRDDWRRLRDALAAAVEAGTLPVARERLIAFDVLAHEARAEGRAPRQLRRDWLRARCDAVERASRQKALRDAARLLEAARTVPALRRTGLLPPELGRLPAPPRPSGRRAAQPLPPRLAAALAALHAAKAGGRPVSALSGHAEDACSEHHLNKLAKGFAWYVDALEALGKLDRAADPAPTEIARPDWLALCVQAEREGALPWNDLAPRSVVGYLKAACQVLLEGGGLPAEVRLALMERRNALLAGKTLSGVAGMSEARQEWCRALVESPAKRRAFLQLAPVLFERAQTAMAGYDRLSAHHKRQALRLAIAAAAAALLTNLPLRVGTLLALDVHGEDAHVFLPRQGAVALAIPPRLLKNGASRETLHVTLGRDGAVDPRRSLAWFLAPGGPREILMAEHMRVAPDPHKLFAGLSYARFQDLWGAATAACGVRMTPHLVRHAIATLLCNRPRPDYSVIAALLGITEATVRRNYAFIDRSKKLAEGQAQLTELRCDARNSPKKQKKMGGD